MADVNLDNDISISSHGGTVSDDIIMSTVADINSKEAIVTFEGVIILNPRDTYSVELHLSLLHVVGETNDFTIQYSSIVHLFCLPESNQNQPHTFVVITLDPPICLGETLHPHIVMQFETDCEIKSPSYTNNEPLNTKFKDKLEPSYKGLVHDFFTKLLCTLSVTMITRPGVFRSMKNDYAVKSTFNAEDGSLYPLAKCFIFLSELPSLFHYTEIDYVELQGDVVPGSYKCYFDLLVRLKTEQEHLFRNIKRSEYYNLRDYFSYIGLKVISNDKGSDSDGEQEIHVERDNKTRKRTKKPPKDGDEDASQKRIRIKDPKRPKPRVTSWGFFSLAERENVKKENPGITFSDIGRLLGEKWRNMTAAEREPYEAKARADMKRYLDEIDEYNRQQSANTTSTNLPEGQALESEDEENAKKENPSATFTRIGRILDKKWSSMSAAEKEFCDILAQGASRLAAIMRRNR